MKTQWGPRPVWKPMTSARLIASFLQTNSQGQMMSLKLKGIATMSFMTTQRNMQKHSSAPTAASKQAEGKLGKIKSLLLNLKRTFLRKLWRNRGSIKRRQLRMRTQLWSYYKKTQICAKAFRRLYRGQCLDENKNKRRVHLRATLTMKMMKKMRMIQCFNSSTTANKKK